MILTERNSTVSFCGALSLDLGLSFKAVPKVETPSQRGLQEGSVSGCLTEAGLWDARDKEAKTKETATLHLRQGWSNRKALGEGDSLSVFE